MERFTPEARIDEYLKKPIDLEKVRTGDQPLSQEESKQIAREQVLRKNSLFVGTRFESFKEKILRNIIWRSKMLTKRKGQKRFNFETLPLILFSSFAIYVSWKMQDRLDQMKRRVVRTKTMREEETERENKLISGALSGKQVFEDQPISSMSDQNAKYRLEGDDEEEARLITNPSIEYAQPDLSEDEMATMMKQYEDKARLLTGGDRPLPNPGYSTDPTVNRRNIERYKPRKG